MNELKVLNGNDIRTLAPSIFSQTPFTGTSERYRMVRTVDVLDILEGEGWQPVMATEQRIRVSERKGFQKHMIRLRAGGDITKGTVPELVLINSHDAKSAFILHGGLFRLVCENGLVVADTTFGKIRLPHIGFDDHAVVKAAGEFVRRLPEIGDRIGSMESTLLSERQRLALAATAVRLRWEKDSPVQPEQLLIPRRRDDEAPDLWSTYNVIQENLMRGGLSGRTSTNKPIHTRAIKAIDAGVGLNRALWSLAVQTLERQVGAS